MVVARNALAEFLARPMDNSDSIKRLTDRELVRRLKRLTPRPRFHTRPYRHQKATFLLAARYGHFLPFLRMGQGKTKVALDLIRWRKLADPKLAALVLVPYTANVEGWLLEVETHQPKLRAVGLDQATKTERERELQKPADVVIATYMGWLALIGKREQRTSGDGKHVIIDRRRADELERRFGFVVFDESTALMNHRSLTFRAARRLGLRCAYRLGMTGTPFDKNPESLWSQFYAVDHGATLGTSLGLYREAFFREEDNFFRREWVFDRRKTKALRRRIKNRSIRFAESECVDLPPLVGGITSKTGELMMRPVGLSEEARGYYNRVLEGITEPNDELQVRNSYHQLRQIAAGFLSVTNEAGERRVTYFAENPKLDALLELIEECPADEKLLIFHHYRPTGLMISAALTDRKLKHVHIFGGARGKSTLLRQFRKDAGTRILLGSTAVAYGLNLQNASRGVFYESPDRGIIREQMEKRLHRMGQKRRTYVYDLVVRRSVDERILRGLQDGTNLVRELIDGNTTAEALRL